MVKRFLFSAILLSLVSLTVFSKEKSVNPRHLQQELHYLYKNIDLDSTFDSVTLKGPAHIKDKEFEPLARTSVLVIEEYLKQLSWSQSIFPATAGSGRGAGSAFYVGGNLVLTNKHVLETTYFQKKCGAFDIKVKIPFDERVKCKEVHYCSRFYDFCLIEMENFSNGDPLSNHIPALKFANTKDKPYLYNIYGIGNSVDLGIQGAKGDHLFRIHEGGKFLFVHYVPAFPGSSGSPLLNERGKVVGINFAQNILWRNGPVIMESLSSKNFAIPTDVMLNLLEKAVPSNQYDQLGKTEIPHVSPRKLKYNLNELLGLMYKQKEVDKVLAFLKRHNTLEKLKNVNEKSFLNTGLSSLIDELNIVNLNERRLMEIIVLEQKNLTEKIVHIIQKNIMENHYEVLKNKAVYQSMVNSCKREQSFDGCLFKKMFRPIFDKAMEGVPLDRHQTQSIWERLENVMNKSRSRDFFYASDEVDVHRLNLATREIKLMDYIAKCVRHQKERFNHIHPIHCKSVTQDILEDFGYGDVSSEFSNEVYQSFLNSEDYLKVISSFSDQVTTREFTCMLANPICEKSRYTRLLELWSYGRELTPGQIEDFVKGLVRKHKRPWPF